MVSAASDFPDVLSLNGQTDGREIGRFMQYFFDMNGRLTIDEISGIQYSDRFRPLGSYNINLGPGKGILWLRFILAAGGLADEGPWMFDLDRPMEQQLILYYQDEAGAWRSISSCRRPPCDPGATPRQSFFQLPPLKVQPKIFYLRVSTKTNLQFFPKIFSAPHFREKSKIRFLAQGLYLGLCLALVLYNFSIFIFLRDQTYLWYVLYVLFLSIYISVTQGLAIELIPFGDEEDLVRLGLVCLGLSILIASQFGRSFLETRIKLPRMDLIMRLYMVLALGAAVFSLFLDIQDVLPIYNLLGGASPLVSLTPAILRYLRGFKPALIYIIGYLAFTGGAVVFVLSPFGVLPLSLWTFHAFQIGSALEILILSLALGERIQMIRREKDALAISQQYYRQTSILDGLTGLYNRRYYEERILDEVISAKRNARALSLLIMDIDHFKDFNDKYGHPQGDRVLARLASILRRCARKSDAACRYGGEEFTLILPETPLDSAYEVGERIRKEFASFDFEIDDETVHGAISIGVAQLKTDESAESLLSRADEALYRAKKEGRNRVIKG